MASGTIHTAGEFYSTIINGDLSVGHGASGNVGLSLTVPAGTYIVTIICKFYAINSGTSYVACSLKGTPQLSDVTTNQASSQSGAQIPLQYTIVIKTTQETVISPHIVVSGASDVTFFDSRSMQAVKIA